MRNREGKERYLALQLAIYILPTLTYLILTYYLRSMVTIHTQIDYRTYSIISCLYCYPVASHVLFSNVTTSLNYNDWRVSDLCISSYAHHTLSRVTRVRVEVQPWIEPVLVLVDRSSFIDLFTTREVSRDFYQSSTYC